MDFETSREGQNSTNATGHLTTVEVPVFSFRISLVRLTKTSSSITNLLNSTDKISNHCKLKYSIPMMKLLILPCH